MVVCRLGIAVAMGVLHRDCHGGCFGQLDGSGEFTSRCGGWLPVRRRERLRFRLDHELMHCLAAVRPASEGEAARRGRRRLHDALGVDVGGRLEWRLIATPRVGDGESRGHSGEGVGDFLWLDIHTIGILEALAVGHGEAELHVGAQNWT